MPLIKTTIWLEEDLWHKCQRTALDEKQSGKRTNAGNRGGKAISAAQVLIEAATGQRPALKTD
jgi:hypothetical protein